MDRARVFSPAISGATHAVAAAVLTCAPLFMTDRLPSPPSPHSAPEGIGFPVVLLGGGGVRRVEAGPPRVTLTASRPVLPLDASFDRAPIPDTTLDFSGLGPAGIGEARDEGAGFCLLDCDGSPGLHAGTARELPESARTPVRVRVGGDIRQPVKVRHVNPVYPALAVAARVEGSVVLECVLTTEGRVSEVTVASGHPLLNDAAVAAVRGWRYRPTLLNGEPVSVILTVTVSFSLR
jgi:TonB family protein